MFQELPKNRNEIIRTLISKTLGYTVQGLVAYSIYQKSPKGLILLKCGTKYGIKLVKHASRKHLRTDFPSETILSDAIDASFFED